MPFRESNSIRYYTSELLDLNYLKHAFFTRHGGISPRPWESLNFGALVGDSTENVSENYQRAFSALDCSLDSRFDVWQVHSTNVVFAESARLPHIPHIKADIIMTDNPALTLFMRFADCVPIMLFDPVKSVTGIVHSGWQGTVKQASAIAVKAMVERYGSTTADIIAVIGPSIGPQRYQVKQDVIAEVRKAFGENAGKLYYSLDDSTYLDLWEANRLILTQSGVHQIETVGICTATRVDDWYSHRQENGSTGRFGALITLGK